jgi:hypothetical protein
VSSDADEGSGIVDPDGIGPAGGSTDAGGSTSEDATPEVGPNLKALDQRRSRRRLRLGFLMLGVVVLLAAALLGNALYQNAIGPDRSDPTVVTQQFLRGAVADRSITEARAYACASLDLNSLIAALPSSNPSVVVVSWNDFSPVISGSNATASVIVHYSTQADNGIFRYNEDWTLGLVLQNGWQVCSVTRVPAQ